MENQVTRYLKYVNLQMAAESMFRVRPSASPGAVSTDMDVASLVAGNNRNSKFAQAQADQLIADGWTVVEHKSNTTTGFSGTLFKNTQTGELVLSFRSTEFLDDAVRDGKTNELEVKSHGWAFGQIADMQQWFAQLDADPGKLGGKSFAVTGYSLGGHLATAFSLLMREAGQDGRISGTYTFNGAGVGGIGPAATLVQVVDDFRRPSQNTSDQEFTFNDAGLVDLYARALQAVNADGSISAQDQRALPGCQWPRASNFPQYRSRA